MSVGRRGVNREWKIQSVFTDTHAGEDCVRISSIQYLWGHWTAVTLELPPIIQLNQALQDLLLREYAHCFGEGANASSLLLDSVCTSASDAANAVYVCVLRIYSVLIRSPS
jgi:hypothetical protein